jgi:hypothetical protein
MVSTFPACLRVLLSFYLIFSLTSITVGRAFRSTVFAVTASREEREK